jgi:hypothetical protein
VATLASINADEPIVAPVVGSGGVCLWQQSGVTWSVLCWHILQGFGFIRRSHALYIERCNLNAICKDNLINCISVKQEVVHSRKL